MEYMNKEMKKEERRATDIYYSVQGINKVYINTPWRSGSYDGNRAIEKLLLYLAWAHTGEDVTIEEIKGKLVVVYRGYEKAVLKLPSMAAGEYLKDGLPLEMVDAVWRIHDFIELVKQELRTFRVSVFKKNNIVVSEVREN